MSIMPQDPDSKLDPPPCTTIGCPEPGTVYGVYGIYGDGDVQSRAHYCPECAGYLYREFTPTASAATLDLRGLIVAALPLPGEVMTPEAWNRVVDDLLLRDAR